MKKSHIVNDDCQMFMDDVVLVRLYQMKIFLNFWLYSISCNMKWLFRNMSPSCPLSPMNEKGSGYLQTGTNDSINQTIINKDGRLRATSEQ